MNRIITLAKPIFEEKEINSLVTVLKSGNLVQGKIVETVETKISKIISSKYSSMVSNGTASLHLALKALNIGLGDEVIIPAFSYIATANVVELVGAKPVFVDINIKTFNIDETQIESKITKNTKAIMPVHEFGLCANMESIMAIAKKHNLFVIEDAACALGAKINNIYAGTFGDFGSFSFHPRKAITSGEGGCVVTYNENYNKIIKTLRNHGIEYGKTEMNFVEAGFNYRMTDFQAALLNEQIDNLDFIFTKKSIFADIYKNEMKNKNLTLPYVPENYRHTWQTFHLLTESEDMRNNLISFLKENQVYTNYGAQCMPLMTYYQNKYKHDCEKEFPNAYKSYKCGIAIPIHENLVKEDIIFICKLLNKF